ncbi:polygalacturonase-like [Lotus japonicus]|uniref:polygalacturonase-like n=1 Tax=Lotus japonicus TaxID=34305 RepID=UPI00258A04DE|nr:polygalacturonase-like [Lotus japonicus]
MRNAKPKLSPFVSILILMILCCWENSTKVNAATTYNVVSFGAKSDGQTDSTKAFLSAWSKACSSPNPATINVPPGRFVVGSVNFRGKCNNTAISITINGTLVAPSDYRVTGITGHWLLFNNVEGVSIQGGVLDGQGKSLWDCKNLGNRDCGPFGAKTLEFKNSKNIVVAGLTSINSQVIHIFFTGCQNVKAQSLNVMAAGNSQNTDGIHVDKSSNVTIVDSKIHTGDDCISNGPGTINLWIQNITCGPGHGISIGSLGWEQNELGVQNVTVKAVKFTGTQNGVRIKSWGRPSNGFVKNVLFQDATMVNVQNPIIIDQNYCPSKKNCPGQASGIKISDVTYQHIRGTSATQVGIMFDCSSMYPCSGIKLEDVKLTYKNQDAQASCNHAHVSALGSVQLKKCL